MIAIVPFAGLGGASAPQSGAGKIIGQAWSVAAHLDTPEEAWAAGYRPDHFCIPGMGVHWINPALFDATLDPERPEVLLFLPDTSDMTDFSGDRFLGIEYVVVTPEGSTPPSLHGVTFHGPMAGHSATMPWHSELHVYLTRGEVRDRTLPQTIESAVCPAGTTPPEP